jgi:hypothetical protein
VEAAAQEQAPEPVPVLMPLVPPALPALLPLAPLQAGKRVKVVHLRIR